MSKPDTTKRKVPTPLSEFNRLLGLFSSQKEFAEYIGITKQRVNHIVKGRRSVTLDIAEKLGFKLVLVWKKLP